MNFILDNRAGVWARRKMKVLSPRHRHMAAIALFAGLSLIVIFGMLLPAWNYRNDAVGRYRELQGSVEWMQSEIGRAKAVMTERRREQNSGSELSAVSKLAREAGLTQLRTSNRTGGGVTAVIPDCRYEDLIKWFQSLSEHGYSVLQVRVESLRSGRVSANLGVRRG